MASIFSFIKNPELAGQLAGDLVKDEFGALAAKGKRYAPGVILLGAGLLVAIAGLILLILSLLEVLTFVMPFWLAAALIGFSLVAIATGLGFQAKASFAAAALPEDAA